MSDQRDKWREAARRILKDIPDVDVSSWSHVQEVYDGGAYVEVIVWVPKSALQQSDDERKS